MKEPLGVVGAGWVGLVTAACLADLGHVVVVCDVDADRVQELEEGKVPIHEPGLSEILRRNKGRLCFTTRTADVFERSELALVCVGTPPTYSGDADLSAVWQVVDELPVAREDVVLVMKSTVPPGTGERIRARLDARGLARVGYVSNPEFLAEGTAVRDFMRPDRVIIGSFDDADGDRVAAQYEPLQAPVVRADVTSAEMIKYASNAFLATKISFINEIANVCEEVGADVRTVAGGMGLDRRIGPHFLRAGVGYGGSCFPKDVAALKQLAGNSGYHFQLLTSVIEVNELQKRRVLGKLRNHLGSLRDRTIALLGLAFKPNTNDIREACSLVLASRLLAEGARVRAWDPVAIEEARPFLPGVGFVTIFSRQSPGRTPL
jgi:UDPglucose 6-dehydrogenase